jgi:hypothetical protein
MKLTSTLISIVVAMFVTGDANAASILVQATSPLNLAGSVSTVTVSLTTLPSETVPPLGVFVVQVQWDPDVVKVLGSNPPTTFGNSSQSAILPGMTGSLTPTCVNAGALAGRACTVVTQSTVAGTTLTGGQVVIGNLLLEVLGGDPIGTSLGLALSNYNNNGVTVPGSDPYLVIDPSFPNAVLIPEPTTGALVGLGLMGLGLVARRRG